MNFKLFLEISLDDITEQEAREILRLNPQEKNGFTIWSKYQTLKDILKDQELEDLNTAINFFAQSYPYLKNQLNRSEPIKQPKQLEKSKTIEQLMQIVNSYIIDAKRNARMDLLPGESISTEELKKTNEKINKEILPWLNQIKTLITPENTTAIDWMKSLPQTKEIESIINSLQKPKEIVKEKPLPLPKPEPLPKTVLEIVEGPNPNQEDIYNVYTEQPNSFALTLQTLVKLGFHGLDYLFNNPPPHQPIQHTVQFLIRSYHLIHQLRPLFDNLSPGQKLTLQPFITNIRTFLDNFQSRTDQNVNQGVYQHERDHYLTPSLTLLNQMTIK